MLKTLGSVMLIVGLGGFVGACGDDDDDDGGGGGGGGAQRNLIEAMEARGNFTTLLGALERTGLDDTLRGAGPYTVFAPTDEAFANLPANVLANLDDTQLGNILSYHVYSGRVSASDLGGLETVATLQGEDISIIASGDDFLLNGFARVTNPDIRAENGTLHIIDSVMGPPSLPFPGTIMDALAAFPSYSTLLEAINTAGLDATLAGDNAGAGYTLFAPTNAAFEALGVDLSTLTTAELSDILLFHVVGNRVPASAITSLTSAPTLQGTDVGVSVTGDVVTLDGTAEVLVPDFEVENGIIHFIDAVLQP